MAEVFLKVVNMSISATWMVLIVLIARVFLKKAPKWISILLWALLGLRLICPFSFESMFSLIPSSETVRPEIMLSPAPSIQTGVPFLDDAVNPIISQTFAPDPAVSANPLQIVIPVAANLWLLGIVALVLYTAVSYFRLKLRLREATLYTENIYLSENIPAPFVLGFTKPVIYLPYNMTVSDMQHVIAHERAHIQRKDHWWKPLGFLVLSIHWLNPVMWLAYILFCRDIEMSCDEKVVKALSPEQRADYSTALLTCSTGRRRIAPCPLAFGETGIKERIKAVLHYKKPALWILIIAAVLCVVIAVCCLTDPIGYDHSYALTDKKEAEICQSYWDMYVGKSENITVADLRAECVYQSEEIYAIFIHDPRLGYSMAVRRESIGGVIFEFPDGQPLYIYTQGKVYDLKMAYDNKIIGVDYLKRMKTAGVHFYRAVS
ncbi:MAG: hypothetical protein IJF02_02600 [Oscillospiraceae bacterium]|nr:hypothetical protein [Oscillospiraceae bacterium]